MAVLSKCIARSRMAEISPFLKGDILDLGCGEAQVLKDYGHKMDSYLGVERSEALVRQLENNNPEGSFVQRDLNKDRLDLKKKFGCVIMVAMIEHIFNKMHLMDEVKAVLKPGGVVVIATPTPFGNDFTNRI